MDSYPVMLCRLSTRLKQEIKGDKGNGLKK